MKRDVLEERFIPPLKKREGSIIENIGITDVTNLNSVQRKLVMGIDRAVSTL